MSLKSDKVIIETHAYNAEKSIHRCVDSILEQTHGNIEYYLLDNASTDSTGDIIREYAKKDSRIRPFFYKGNSILRWYYEVITPMLRDSVNRSCWFASLSADDEYDLTFIEKALNFCRKNEILITACCSDPIDEETKVNLARYRLKNSLIIEGEEFSSKFPEYYRYFGTLWGKLISISLYQRNQNDPYFDELELCQALPQYYADTSHVLGLLMNSRKIGVLADVLHKRYMSSSSLVADPIAIKTAEMNNDLVKNMNSFLLSKCGYISPQNDAFIWQTYCKASMTYLERILAAKNTMHEKVRDLLIAFDSGEMHKLFTSSHVHDKQKKQLLATVSNFISDLPNGSRDIEAVHRLDNTIKKLSAAATS